MGTTLDRVRLARRRITERLEDWCTEPGWSDAEMMAFQQWMRTGTLPSWRQLRGLVCAAGQDALLDMDEIDALLAGCFP